MKTFTRWTIPALALLCAAIANAQTVDDYACPTATTVSNASPAIVTCPSPHGFNMRGLVAFVLSNNPAANDTITTDTGGSATTYKFVTSLSGAANEVLIGQNSRQSTWNLYQAVNDTGFLKGTVYGNGTVANPTFTLDTSFQAASGFFRYITPGTAGIGIPVTTNHSANISIDTPTTRMEWQVNIRGGAGSWASIGSYTTPKLFYARYISATEFALYSNQTTAYDSTGNGTFTGQTLAIQRAIPPGNLYPTVATQQTWSITGNPIAGNQLQVVIPGCGNTAHELECSQAHNVPDQNVVTQGNFSNFSTFTISSGVATITLPSAYTWCSGCEMNIVAGALVWLRQITDTPTTPPGGSFTHTVSLSNDAAGTVANHLVKYAGPRTNGVRGPILQDPLGATGGVIGVCQGGCGTSGTAVIADAGLMACVFDNAHTVGDWVSPTGYDDRCHDVGVNFPVGTQPIGTVQGNGAAGATDNIWWNGLNRAFTVQTIDGPADGSNVRTITFNVPGYPDGNYNATSVLPGSTFYYSGARLSAFVGKQLLATPYLIWAASQAVYTYPGFPLFVKDQAGLAPTTNRLTFRVKWNTPEKQCLINSGALSIGTYIFWPHFPVGNNQGTHYYNQTDPEIYPGWTTYTIDLAPSHRQTVNTAFNYPQDFTFQGSANGWYGAGHYFDRMTTWYQDLSGTFCPPSRDVTGQTILVSPVTLANVSNEPDEVVRARTGQWAASLFQPGDSDHTPTGPSGYTLSWAAPINGVPSQYEVRYCPTASGHTVGFQTCLCNTTGTTTCGAGDRVSTNGSIEAALYKTNSAMSQAANIWWAIKPISTPVASTTGNTQNPTWIITPIDMQYTVGDPVTVSGVTGNGAANVTGSPITAVQPRQYWTVFDPRPFVLTGNSYSNAGGVVQVFQAFHDLITGQTVQIYNATGTGLNGQWAVTVVDGNNFTLNGSSFASICPCSGGSMRQDVPAPTTNQLVSVVSDATASPNTICTATTGAAHHLLAGWKFDMMGAPDSHLSDVDGVTATTYTITGAPSSTTFTFVCGSGTPTSTTFNTDSPSGNNFLLESWPAFAVGVAGTGTYNNGGTFFATGGTPGSGPDTRNFAEITLTGNASNASAGTILQGTSPRGLIAH